MAALAADLGVRTLDVIEQPTAVTRDSDAHFGLWWYFTVGLCSLGASVFAWLTQSTALVEDSWSALVQELTLLLALTGIAVAAWLAINAVRRNQRLAALLVGVPTLLGLVKPAAAFLVTLGELFQVLLAD